MNDESWMTKRAKMLLQNWSCSWNITTNGFNETVLIEIMLILEMDMFVFQEPICTRKQQHMCNSSEE